MMLTDRAAAERVEGLDWPAIEAALESAGHARVPGLLGAADCAALAGLYDDDRLFRRDIVMARHGYGEGEYRYFGYPLPPAVAALRRAFYARLAPLAQRWRDPLGLEHAIPDTLDEFLALCHAQDQTRPTPLLLRYRAGGWNALHQDSYGALAFPLQVAVCLSRRERDFTGGEFLLVEQRPRMQSRGEAIALDRGEAVIFPNRTRPARGKRGTHRLNVRHGVSRLQSGSRTTLGLIFHDAA